MKFTLLVVLLSSGLYRHDYITEQDCLDHLLEFQVIAGKDLWTGTCVDDMGAQSEVVFRQEGDIGP